MSKQITWMQAAEILGMSARNMRRYRNRLEPVAVQVERAFVRKLDDDGLLVTKTATRHSAPPPVG
jgi:hypothetical protein